MCKYLCSNIKHLWIHGQELTSRLLVDMFLVCEKLPDWFPFASLVYTTNNCVMMTIPRRRVLWNLNIDLICISMMANDAEHFKNFTYPFVFLFL